MKHDANTQALRPIGKLKGEIDGEFESLYVAADQDGNLYKNHNPGYKKNRYELSQGWEPINPEQFEELKKQLHFIPHKNKGLKP